MGSNSRGDGISSGVGVAHARLAPTNHWAETVERMLSNNAFQPTPSRAANGRYSLSVALVIESASTNIGGG